MRFTRFHFGIITTVVWIVLMGIAVRDPCRLLTMELNELGDFLAGFFAPLAFLWLVLGYLQQGEELQHSTKALQLQAEELRNSVEQQRELVEVTRQQLDSEREASALEQRTRTEAAKPRFVFKETGRDSHPPNLWVNINVQNKGGDVKNVLGCIDVLNKPPIVVIDEYMFESSKVVTMKRTEMKNLMGALLKITYVDTYNNAGTYSYHIRKSNKNALSFDLVEA
jgi:hypothetical protein